MAEPSDEQIVDAIDSLTVDGGPGFAILDGGANDYVQAAGGDGVYLTEWREYTGRDFRHFVAGIGPTTSEEYTFRVSGYLITLRTNEVLAVADVKTIFLAFHHGKGRPMNYTWRDITEIF